MTHVQPLQIYQTCPTATEEEERELHNWATASFRPLSTCHPQAKLKWWRQHLLILVPLPISSLSLYLVWLRAVAWQPFIVYMPSCMALIPAASSCCLRALTDTISGPSPSLSPSPSKSDQCTRGGEPRAYFPFLGEIILLCTCSFCVSLCAPVSRLLNSIQLVGCFLVVKQRDLFKAFILSEPPHPAYFY